MDCLQRHWATISLLKIISLSLFFFLSFLFWRFPKKLAGACMEKNWCPLVFIISLLTPNLYIGLLKYVSSLTHTHTITKLIYVYYKKKLKKETRLQQKRSSPKLEQKTPSSPAWRTLLESRNTFCHLTRLLFFCQQCTKTQSRSFKNFKIKKEKWQGSVLSPAGRKVKKPEKKRTRNRWEHARGEWTFVSTSQGICSSVAGEPPQHPHHD